MQTVVNALQQRAAARALLLAFVILSVAFCLAPIQVEVATLFYVGLLAPALGIAAMAGVMAWNWRVFWILLGAGFLVTAFVVVGASNGGLALPILPRRPVSPSTKPSDRLPPPLGCGPTSLKRRSSRPLQALHDRAAHHPVLVALAEKAQLLGEMGDALAIARLGERIGEIGAPIAALGPIGVEHALHVPGDVAERVRLA